MSRISIEELMNKTGNLYEAVAIMAKRARQVNQKQHNTLELEKDVVIPAENRDMEDFDEVEIDRDALLRDHEKLPKPTRIAIEEMMDDEISFRYKNEKQAE